MATKKQPAKPKLEGDVVLVPVPGHWIPGVPAVTQVVDADRATELLKYFPPAFTVGSAEDLAPAEPVKESTEAPVAGEETPS